MTTTAQCQTRAGAELLDLARPGWDQERTIDGQLLLNVDTLDLSDVRNCVLGQLWGTYGSYGFSYGLNYLRAYSDDGTLDFGARHGFDTITPEHYAELTEAWRALINERRLSADVAQQVD